MIEYKPGTCNISQTGRKKRLVLGGVGFLNAGILTAILAFFPGSTPVYLAVFILNFVGFLGFLQYRNSFCAGLALKKKFKVSDKEEEVGASEKISKDRRKAFLIILESGILAFLATSLIYLVLHNF